MLLNTAALTKTVTGGIGVERKLFRKRPVASSFSVYYSLFTTVAGFSSF